MHLVAQTDEDTTRRFLELPRFWGYVLRSSRSLFMVAGIEWYCYWYVVSFNLCSYFDLNVIESLTFRTDSPLVEESRGPKPTHQKYHISSAEYFGCSTMKYTLKTLAGMPLIPAALASLM